MTAEASAFAPIAALAGLAGLGLAVALFVALATPIVWPAVAHLARSRPPATRERLAWAAALAPIVLPAGIVWLCALPGLLGALTGLGDHCAGHGEHPHFCPVHATLALTPLLALGGAGFLALTGALLLGAVGDGLALARERRWLARRWAGELESGVQLVAGETPIALTRGLRSPEIWITQSLLEDLDATDRAVVLAHERAHAARRDPARLLAAQLASRLHLPKVRGQILSALRLATEQRCDDHAAEQIGDRLQVAETLLRVARRMQRKPAGDWTLVAPLVDASLPARIEALVADPSPATRSAQGAQGERPRWPWITALAAFGMLLLARPVHHLAEHALEALLRSMVGVPGLS